MAGGTGGSFAYYGLCWDHLGLIVMFTCASTVQQGGMLHAPIRCSHNGLYVEQVSVVFIHLLIMLARMVVMPRHSKYVPANDQAPVAAEIYADAADQ